MPPCPSAKCPPTGPAGPFNCRSRQARMASPFRGISGFPLLKFPLSPPITQAVELPGLYPPPEVWAEVDAAARRVDQLEAEGRELDFRLDEPSGRLSIELRDLAGTVFREVSAAEAVAIAEGARAR